MEVADCLVEYRHGGHCGAIDIDDESKVPTVVEMLTPFTDAGALVWE